MTRHSWQCLPFLFVVLAVACGAPSQGEGEDTSGAAQFVGTLEQALSATDVTSVVVTVSAANMPQPRTVSLVRTNSQWSGTIGNLSAGTGRTFTAEAFSSSGTKLYAGTAAGVTILARQTTSVAITLQEVNAPPPFANAAPVISSLSVAPGTVEISGTVVLNAAATDANAGDTLTYAWSAPSGTFAQPGSLSTTWTAPSSAATVPLTLAVTDSLGTTTRVTFNVNVTNGRGEALVNASLNTWPQVSNISTSTTSLELNESTTVSATTVDNDGDTLSYSWEATCAGTWTNATSATAQFTATALPASNVCNNCNLIVTVTDSRNGQPVGGQTTGTLSLCVGPRRTAVFPPDITETFQSAAITTANGTVTFRVGAVDPQGSALNFAWAANTGTPGSPTPSAGASQVVWTAPACVASGTTPTITATVSNALGASASQSFTVAGLATCATPPPPPPPQVAPSSLLGAGTLHSVHVKQDGTVWVWGANNQGQLGDGTTTTRPAPQQVLGLSGIIAVGAGNIHTVALSQGGTVWAWGTNASGELGDGTRTNRSSPGQVTGLSGVTAIAVGIAHTAALRQDGTVWIWGDNTSGQIGDGTLTDRIFPVQVPNLSGVTAVAAGGNTTMALRQDGTVWVWGNNGQGQLGDGTTTNRTSPQQVPNLSGVTALAAGSNHTVALRQDGTVWTCGYNTSGQLGDGTTASRSLPAQVPNLSGVTAISAGAQYTVALRQDGSVRAWGSNTQGQLGDGTTVNRTSPVTVPFPGLSGVVAIEAGSDHTLAIRQDGTLWAWGYNAQGKLGDGTTGVTPRTTPGPVSSF